MQHGGGRAEEMREAAATVKGAGVEPPMASATADLQAWFGEPRAQGAFDGIGGNAAWLEMADRIEAELRETGERAAQGSMP